MSVANMELQKIISLDVIMEGILDNMEEHMLPFIKECEKDIRVKLNDYTGKAISEHDKDIMQIAESYANDLLNSVCAANHKYFEIGMKVGASLLLQLLNE